MNMFKRFFWVFITSIIVLIVLSWLLVSTMATEWFEKGDLTTVFNTGLLNNLTSASSQSETSSQSSSASDSANDSSNSSSSSQAVSTSAESSTSSSNSSQASDTTGQTSSQSNSQSETKAGIKIVTAVANGSVLTALNWRATPCGQINGQPKVWGTRGRLITESATQRVDNCQLGSFEWVHVRWDDGTEGWSIAENLQITDNLPR